MVSCQDLLKLGDIEIFEKWGLGTTAKFDNSYGNKIKVKQ